MAHFAKVEGGVVTDLIVIQNKDCGGGDFPESESIGREFISALAENDLRFEGEWFQTSYNTRDGLHYPNGMEFNIVDGNIVPINGVSKDAFRWTFGLIGYRFDPNAGEYGEFRLSLESE